MRLIEAFAASAATAVATARAVATDLERMASVVQSSSDAIITTHASGLIASWNAGAEELYGFRAEEMLEREATALLPADKAGDREIFARVFGGDVIKRYETIRVRKDGSRVDVSLSVSAIRDSSGRVVGVASIARDISERREMERALAQAQRIESLGQLAGGVAHDMNNLLAVILNHADFALETIDDPQAGEEVNEIRGAAERAAALVRQLLQFARQETVTEQVLDANTIQPQARHAPMRNL